MNYKYKAHSRGVNEDDVTRNKGNANNIYRGIMRVWVEQVNKAQAKGTEQKPKPQEARKKCGRTRLEKQSTTECWE